MEHVCKVSGPQRDLQLPPETVAYLKGACSHGVFFFTDALPWLNFSMSIA